MTGEETKLKPKLKKGKIVYALDWTAENYEDRKACVESLEQEGLLENLSTAQLNEVSNYLLYSRDVECEVKLKTPSREPASYEEMVENGIADIAFRNAKYASLYKNPKPTIDREKDKDIPGMQELWEAIEPIKEVYDYLDDCLKGRREKAFDKPIEINYVNHHFYKNWYIDLCMQQYALKDIHRPTVMIDKSNHVVSLRSDEPEWHFGLKVGPYVYNESHDDKMIDLGDPKHIYLILKRYGELRESHTESVTDDWRMIFEMIDDAIAEYSFKDWMWDILEMKINKVQNEEVSKKIKVKYNMDFGNNYISSLFTGSLSRRIANSALLLAKRKFGDTGQRECTKCKEVRWNDEFTSGVKSCNYCRHKRYGTGRKLEIWRG